LFVAFHVVAVVFLVVQKSLQVKQNINNLTK